MPGYFQKYSTFKRLHLECSSETPQLSFIRNLLEKFSRKERKELVSNTKDECAPLFVACKKGNAEIVKFLTEECDANIEQCGIYESPWNGETYSVTPLWCASAEGKLNVVEYLCERGANVNSATVTGWTAVKAACFLNNYDIVKLLLEKNADISKPDNKGETCLMSSIQCKSLCKLLILNGADVNAQNARLETALHQTIKVRAYETAELLMENGADPFIKNCHGEDALQTACLASNIRVFEYLLKIFNYTKQRIVEAHELMGSMLLEDHLNLRECLSHWRTALSIRYSDPDNIIPKNCVSKAAYEYLTEFNSPEELNHLDNIQEIEHIVMNYNLQIQSLLVRERILGLSHPRIIYKLMTLGLACSYNLQYQRCINLWKHALEIVLKKYNLLYNDTCCVIERLRNACFDFLEKHEILQEQIQFKDVYDIINMIGNNLHTRVVLETERNNFDKILTALTHLIYIINVIQKTPDQEIMVEELIKNILRMNPRTSTGDTLLHLVVAKSYIPKPNSLKIIFPNVAVVKFVLKCGANAEATNYCRSSPLHLAAKASNFCRDIIEVLLNHGAHYDRRNALGDVPYIMLQKIAECNICPSHYINLKCLAARKVMEQKIFFEGQVPRCLEDFIRIH